MHQQPTHGLSEFLTSLIMPALPLAVHQPHGSSTAGPYTTHRVPAGQYWYHYHTSQHGQAYRRHVSLHLIQLVVQEVRGSNHSADAGLTDGGGGGGRGSSGSGSGSSSGSLCASMHSSALLAF